LVGSNQMKFTFSWLKDHLDTDASLAAIVDKNCAQARRFAEGLRAAGYEILNEVVLNRKTLE